MTFIEILPPLMFATLLLLLMTGFPVAFVLPGVAILFGLIGSTLDIFHLGDFGMVPLRIWGILSNFSLIAVPLFIFMGMMLEKSGIAEELLETTSKLFHKQRGSLAIAVVLVGAVLAATTGVVGATVVTMGVISLPTMLKAGYKKELATGTIAASGTLGQIIPPSIILVLLGDIMGLDVGDLFIGALMPGILLVSLYIIYIAAYARLYPAAVPLVIDDSPIKGLSRYVTLIKTLLPAAFLIFLVLGSILLGIASPTESAACGGVGAIIFTFWRRKLTWSMLFEVAEKTGRLTAMVFTILIGAQFFGIVFRGLSGEDLITNLIAHFGMEPFWVISALMLLIFVLGCFLDFLEICFIVLPIIMPIIRNLGVDPLWLAIMIAVNLQTSFLTPPFGFSLFYLKGSAPPEIKTTHIYRGIIPFVLLQIIALILIALFPEIVTWLPRIAYQSLSS